MKLKDKIKINVFPSVVSFLHALGFSWEKLGRFSFFSKSVLLAQAKLLGKFEVDPVAKPQKIYVLLMLSQSTFHLYIEVLLALGLKKKGHQVTFIIDDNTLPIQEFKRRGSEHKWDNQTETAFAYASKFLDDSGLNYFTISEFIKDAPSELEYKDKYAPVLEASLLKHYKVGSLSKNLPDIENRTKLFKKAIGITDYIGEKLVKLKVDKVIMNHGIYSTWGPPYQVLDAHNIPILVHSRAKKKYAQVFNWNKTGDSWDVIDEWNRVKDIELTEAQLKEITDYIGTRIMHKDDVTVYNFGNKTSKEETIKSLGIDTDKPVYSLFTNVLWDAASAHREISFKNPIEWVIETVKWFNQHPEKQLIVKIHPAEVIAGTNMPFYDIIHNAVTPNDNVKIIKPDAKVNSWSIYEITDLGLVHTTTAGMELPLVYKPCVVVSQTHYRGKRFTIDVNSIEEYFEVLDNFDVNDYDLEKNRMEALKYAYLLFIRYQTPFEMFFERTPSDFRGFRFDNINDFIKYKNFNSIITNIENHQPIFSK
ncbi:hypothetical protein EGM88_14365 [Aureibaculum marinum]|uniref:Capsule polysaccharide biosynthesis protein n=1 Tax=Aureibaculum marinum TaxID=2487930 RepID=A0A3N4NI07_9FLAO|nr:hypothetical protein [Aureibaculum marinum]RPD91720.1 hypothetical protein EGM88_14365 [Aureibaculum marinum]